MGKMEGVRCTRGIDGDSRQGGDMPDISGCFLGYYQSDQRIGPIL